VRDPEARPPDGQLAQAEQAGARERAAVVGADRVGEPELAERGLERRPGRAAAGVGQGLAPDQVPAVRVGDRQRLAPAAVPAPEPPLEVRAPQAVRAAAAAAARRFAARWAA
jgi:hypothetical protein